MTVPISEIQRLIDELHRYTITSEGASKGYFRLVEDPQGCWVQWPEVAALRSALGAAPQKEALNIDGEPLHTGDDDRIDCLTGIRAGLEEIVNAEDDEYEKHEIIELVRELFDDCDQLYALLIETIARERDALSAAPAARQEEPKDVHESRSPDGDGPELPETQHGAGRNKEPRHNAQIAGDPEEEQRGQQTAGAQGRGGQPLTVNAGDGLCNSGPRHTNAHRLAVQGAGSEPADSLSLPVPPKDESAVVRAALSLANSLPDVVVESLREEWGNTNVAVVKHWRDRVLAALDPRPQEQP